MSHICIFYLTFRYCYYIFTNNVILSIRAFQKRSKEKRIETRGIKRERKIENILRGKSQFTHESTASHPCSTPLSWISRVPSPRHGRWSRREGSRPVSSGLPLREVFSYWSVRKVSQMALSVSTREREIYSSYTDIRVWRIERILREISVALFA